MNEQENDKSPERDKNIKKEIREFSMEHVDSVG
jgi:hypothetical protein